MLSGTPSGLLMLLSGSRSRVTRGWALQNRILCGLLGMGTPGILGGTLRGVSEGTSRFNYPASNNSSLGDKEANALIFNAMRTQALFFSVKVALAVGCARLRLGERSQAQLSPGEATGSKPIFSQG